MKTLPNRLPLTVLCAIGCLDALGVVAAPDSETEPYGLETRILSVASSSPWAAAIQDDPSGPALTELMSTLNQAEGVEILAAPRLITLAGQEATLEVVSELTYFERREDGLFELRTLSRDEHPGIRLTATMNPGREGTVELELDLRVSAVLERESIPGVGLDVGRPIMQLQQIQTRLSLEPGEWTEVGKLRIKDVTSGAEEAVVVLARVTIHGPGG